MTKRTCALVFIIFLCYTLIPSVYCVAASYFKLNAASTTLPDSMTLVSMEGLSVLACSAYCDRTYDCNSFSYGPDNGSCVLSETTALTVDSLTVISTKWKVFVKGMHVSSYIESCLFLFIRVGQRVLYVSAPDLQKNVVFLSFQNGFGDLCLLLLSKIKS